LEGKFMDGKVKGAIDHYSYGHDHASIPHNHNVHENQKRKIEN
jgi:hypothetical protein